MRLWLLVAPSAVLAQREGTEEWRRLDQAWLASFKGVNSLTKCEVRGDT